MSAVAALYNVPSTLGELDTWSFAHAAHHHDIVRTIYQKSGKRLDEYVLDPFDPVNPHNWLYQHQLMHNQMDAILLISGFDLLDVDMTNPNEFSGCFFSRFN